MCVTAKKVVLGRLLNVGQPGLKGVILPLHYSEEGLLQLVRDGTGASVPNRAIVHFANRGDLGGRASKERFVGNVEFIPGKDRFVHR